MSETMYTIFKRSPEEALEEAFKRYAARVSYDVGGLFCYTSLYDKEGRTRYGSYKHITRKSLEGRQYKIECLDYAIGIFYTDAYHDPITYKTVMKEKTMHTIYLSRRNLEALLAKLDARAEGEATACTIIKYRDSTVKIYQQTVDSISVVAVPDEDYYGALQRPAGEMHPREEAKLYKPSTGVTFPVDLGNRGVHQAATGDYDAI